MSLDRSLDDLHPWVAAKAYRFLAEVQNAIAAKHLVPVSGLLIVSTVRTPEQQAILQQEGRSNAPPGKSAHEYGLAFDCVPLDADGKPWWKAPDAIWLALQQLADKCGLDPLGMQGGEYLPWDKGHMQEPGWKLLVAAGLVQTIKGCAGPPAPPPSASSSDASTPR